MTNDLCDMIMEVLKAFLCLQQKETVIDIDVRGKFNEAGGLAVTLCKLGMMVVCDCHTVMRFIMIHSLFSPSLKKLFFESTSA